MAEILRSSGLRIDLPNGVVLAEPAPADALRRGDRQYGPRPLPSAEGPSSPLIEALARQDLEIVDTLDLDATPQIAAEVRAARPVERSVDLGLEVGPDEDAVVLLEQDGMYSWHLPSVVPEVAERRSAGTSRREKRFRIILGRPVTDSDEFRRRGFVSDFIVGKVRAYVLKFAVAWGTESLMTYLERNVRKGLVDLSPADPDLWSRLDGLDTLALPEDRPARLLLFIHGTFSSTLGSYGALAATPEGEALLRNANARYDAVIGFDHPTLSLSPTQNARELLDALAAYPWPMPPHLDIITFSRGGLVYRALAELLLPGSSSAWRPSIDRVIFVAVPNAGTHLAEPDNWHALLDLYTNLAAAAGSLLAKIPQFTIATKILGELIQGLGALGKLLATQAVTNGDVPGLAAMAPDGPFITELNRVQTGQPTVDTTYYCAVTSEFEVRLLGDGVVPKEFSRRLAMTLIDRVANRLFGVANDLVVDTGSMTAIDHTAADFIKDHFDFGKTALVYHTVYFAQPAVALALARWLRLDEPDAMAMRAGSGDWIAPGGTVAPILPPRVETNLIVASATDTLDALRDDMQYKPDAELVVVRRSDQGRQLDYAFRRGEIASLSDGRPGELSVLDGLDLREFQASATSGPGAGIVPPPASGAGPSTGRVVILDDGYPVGVLPEPNLSRTAVIEPAEADQELAPGSLGEPLRRIRGGARSGQILLPEIRLTEAQRSAPVEAPTAAVQCHVYAEMPGTVRLGEDTSLLVSVSRELIQAAAGMATGSGAADVDPNRRIILDLRARRNFVVVGALRAEFDPPAPDHPQDRYFTVRATDPGDGEVWVTARQGQEPLVTLKLHVRITAEQPEVSSPVSVRASTDEPAEVAAPLCQLRIFDRSNGDRLSYEYELDIPGLVFGHFESPQIQGSPSQYVEALYREIERRWISARQDTVAFADEMREMGAGLFADLFPLELQRALWDHRDAIRRIQVVSTEPFIPWEIVHLTEPGGVLPEQTCFLAQLGLVRWLWGSYYPSEVRIRNERVRYVIPDYPHPDDRLPATADEAAYLEQAFQASAVQPHALPLREVLRGPGSFDLLHFAGHGVAEQDDIANAQIQLQGRVENGRVITEYLSSTAVATQGQLRGADGNRPMVVLNACQAGRVGYRLSGIGGFAPAFINRGAGIFVGTLWSVSDQPAKTFMIRLYDELRAGAGLADAAVAAREAARASGDASWLCYVIYGHPSARIIV